MTQGKFMLLIVIYIIAVIITGEIFYRSECRQKKKDYGLSDYGVRQLVSRTDCYGASLALSLLLLSLVAAVWVIITKWATPL